MAAARRALGGGGKVGAGDGDPGDERHQTILRRPAGRAFDQFRRRQALAHEPAHRAAQPFDGPPLALMVEHADDVAPAVPRPHPLHGRQEAQRRRAGRRDRRGSRAAAIVLIASLRCARAALDCRKLPRASAALMPAFVRSEISARSSWATAPSTCSENMPCGVEVSIGPRSERKSAPRSSSVRSPEAND